MTQSTATMFEYTYKEDSPAFLLVAEGMKEDNKAYYKGSKDELIDNGYEACGNCKP